MFRPLPLFIGLRYTRTRRRERFISFVSLISLLGMVLGVCALIVVMSVMNGFEAELRQRILALVPHGFIDAVDQSMDDWRGIRQRAERHPAIVAAAPYIGSTAMLGRPGRVKAVQLSAIEPALEQRVSTIHEHILSGEYHRLQPGAYGIVLGDILARHLGIGVGDKITLTVPKVTVTPVGIFPRQKRFTVVALFRVGSQLDGSAAFIHLSDGQKLFQLGASVHGLRVQLEDMFASRSALAAAAQSLSTRADEPIRTRDWSVTQGSLFQSVKMEKTMIMLLLLIIVAIAAFNIVSILSMMVADKRGDIAVLRSMGASPRGVTAIFMIQGVAVGVSGVLLGVLLGVPIALNVGDIVSWVESILGVRVFDPSVYFISRIPSVFQWRDVFVVCGAGVVLSLLATLYPSYRAAQIQPAEALRYE